MKTAVTVTAVAAALLASGCGGSKQAASPPATTQAPQPAKTTTSAAPRTLAPCEVAPAAVLRRIATHIVLEGSTLSHAQVVPAIVIPGTYFVSARVDGGGANNMLATWATERLGGTGAVYSVDADAALISSYAAAGQKNPDLSVSDPAAYKSRVCVAGPHAPHGSDAPLSGRPASGR